MSVFAWILGRTRWSRGRGAKANRWDRASLAPNLRVRRLEERRVLNADAAPVQALVVNAGTSAGDGHADTFVVEQHDNQVRISVNGKQISDTPLSQLGTIKIQGSSDDDVLIAEFKSGEPMAGLNLLFDGKGGNDSLVLNSNAPVNGVSYNFGTAGDNHIDIQSSAGTAAIGFSNVESVNDSLTAQTRSFNINSGGQQVTLGDAGSSTDDRSQLEVKNATDGSQSSIVFKNPTADFSLTTSASTDKPDTVTLNGVDHNFHANTHILGSSDDLLLVHGPTDVGGGDLDLSAGTIKVESSLVTNHANLDIHATNEILISSTGSLQNEAGNIRIEAPSIEQDGAIVAHGGLVHLDSGASGTTIVRGSIDVSQSDPGKPAGTVHILGSQVGLFDNAQIDATATVGGGTVLIGGDYQGKNSAIRNALRTYVGSNVVIRADATARGNGGKVIVWANEVNRFYGTITARGGAASGNGGFAEVSGKQDLDYRGTTNLTAAAGNVGNLLLDPDVLIIDLVNDLGLLDVSASDSIVAFADGGATASLSAVFLIAQLNLNLSDITLQANDEIDVNLPIVAGATSTFGLELDAPLIKFAAGANIVLNHADLTIGNTTAGNVELDGNVLLSTAAGAGSPGDITIKGTVTGLAGTEVLQLNSGTGSIDVGGDVSNIATLNVVGANNATFHGAVDATTVTLGNVAGTASILGPLTTTTLTVPVTVNNVSLTGTGSTVTTSVAFANTGTLALGQALGTQTYNGGFNTTAVGGVVTLKGLLETSNDAITLGAVTLGSSTTLDTNATTLAGDITLGAVTGGGFNLTLETASGIVGADVSGTSVGGVGTLALQNIGGTAAFTGAVSATTLTDAATVNNVSLTGTGGTITNLVTFANTGTLTLGQALGTQTYNGGLIATAVTGLVTLNGLITSSNDPITFGPVTLGSNVTLDTNATTAAGDIALGAVTGGGFNLTLETGAVAGADVSGTSVTGVGTLALQSIGGTVAFTGAITVATLTDAATVNNVSLTGTGSTVTNLVTFANTGALTLGQALGNQTYNGGLSATAVTGLVTLNGLITTSNDLIAFGPVTLGSDVTLDTNATTTAGDIALGAVAGGGFNLTLETGAVAGADVSGTSVSGVGTLALQNIGGTAAFTGAVAVAMLTDAATVNNVSLTGTGSAITNLVTFANTGALTLGQALGTQTFNGGFDTTGVGGLVTLNGVLQSSDDPITIGPATLGSNTILDTNATTAAGDITLGAITGGGFNLTLETASGIAGADVSGTTINGVGTLALQNIGGTASFTGAVSATTLTDAATVNNVSLTGTGGTITNLVTFANTGALTLGQALGTQTYNGGLSTTAVTGLVTINGLITSSNDSITFGPVTLGSNVTLDTNATTAAGDIALGAVTGGGFNLTLETGAVAGADVSGTSVSGVGTLALQNIGGTAAFTGPITVATLTDAATVNNLSLTGTGSAITNLVTFANTGTLTLGQALGMQTFNGGFDTTGVGGVVTLNGLLQTSDDLITIGPATLGSNTTLDTNATTAAGDITLGAITGGGFNLALETGAVAGADVSGTSVGGVGTLALQNIGGLASFTGPITAATLTDASTVSNVNLTGTGSAIANLVTFANTGALTLGQALGTQTYNGGFDTTAVGGVVTINGLLQASNDPINVGPITLGSNTTLDTNATTTAGDITLGAVTGGGFNLTLETASGVAGADVNGTTVAGVATLALQNIGGTAAFTGAITVTTLTDVATVNNVSLTGTGSTITNLVTFANAGALTLGQALGTQTYNGGFDTTAVGGVVTLNGILQSSNDLIKIGPASLGSDTTLDTNATTAAGDITLGAITGGGFDLTLETGNAVAGADVTGTSVSGVDTLALQNIGGTASFTGAITATALTDAATVNNVILTGSGSTITNLVTFANTGTLALGQSLGTQTYNGGFNTTVVGGVVTLNGVLQSSDDLITVGAVTLGSNTTLDSNATTTAGDITLGAVTGGGFNLTVETGNAIAGADINGTTVTGVGTLALQNIGGTASFTGAITTTTLTVGATVNNVSLTGNGTVITNLVTFANTGTLALGQNLGTQTYNGGISKTNVGGNITLRGTIATSGDTILLTGPSIDLADATVVTNNANIVFVVDNLIQTASTINAGAGDFRIRPTTNTAVIEFAAIQSIFTPPIAYYNSEFNSITAANFVVGDFGDSTYQGNIHVGNAANVLTVKESVLFRNTGTGQIFLDSDYTSAVANGNLTLTAGAGVTLQDLSVDATVGVNLGNGIFTVNVADITKTTTLAENADIKAAGGITFNSNIDANTAAIDRTLTLDSSIAKAIVVNGDVGATQALAGLTITQSIAATFAKSVNVTAGPTGTITLVDTVGNIDFQGSTSADVLTTAAKGYSVIFGGAVNQIQTNLITNFLNTGTVTLGNDAGDSTTFVGGVSVTTPSAVSIAGIVAATNGASTITLGDVDTAVTATANAKVGGTATGLIDLGDATINNGVTLTVGTGIANAINLDAIKGVAGGAVSDFVINTIGNVAADEAISTDIGTMTIQMANNFTAASTINVNNLVQVQSTAVGISEFKDDVTTSTLIDLTAHRLRAQGTAINKIELTSAGLIKLNVDAVAPGSNSPANLDFANIIISTASGHISEATFAFDPINNRFIALDSSAALPPALTSSQNVAHINVIVADDGLPALPSDGVGFEIQLNWLEGNGISNQYDNSVLNGDTIAPFTHTYLTNPQPNPADDIPMRVYIASLAGGTIQASIGGQQLVAPVDTTTGQLPSGVIGISTTLVIPVLTPFTPAVLPPTEPLPITPPAPPVIEANVELVPAPVELTTPPLASTSAGVTSSGEERFYELRIVTIKKNGKVDERLKDRIRLDDSTLKAINPVNPKSNAVDKFDLGKLPILFGRLPADRYRIYLIEDRSERLILDFTIQQGQPIENREQEDANPEMGNAPTDAFRDEHVLPPARDAVPTPQQNNGAQPPAKSGASDNSAPSKSADAFAERLGKTSFVSRGGVVVGAAALAFSAGDRWEQSIDRLMERFDRRRRSPNRQRTAKRERPLVETLSSTSTHNSR